MKKYIIIIIAVLLVVFGGVYVYSTNKTPKDDTSSLKSKADEEISYLARTVILLMNKFNNINYANYKVVEQSVTEKKDDKTDSSSYEESQSQSSNNDEQKSKSNESGKSQSNSINTTSINIEYSSILVNTGDSIDWDYIKKEVEKMYSTWTTVLIDLNSLNVNKDNLLKYTSTLDNVTKALESKHKETAMEELANLYSLLASYMKDYSDNTTNIYILETKSNILYAYALAEYNDKWTQINEKLKLAQASYMNIVNNRSNDKSGTNSINKAYILLNEIQKTTDKADRKVFYINYKNLMQELDAID